jgi:septum formation protein
MKLILASASPRRAQILRDAGIAFDACASEIAEGALPGETAGKMVARLAEAKARATASQLPAETAAIVIGADTCVERDGEIFCKPRDSVHAAEMLTRLSGGTHHVLTGIFAVRVPDGAARTAVESTSVTFAALNPEEIARYVGSGEPMDKAGGYAIQGRAGRYITRIQGCYFNVVGLPLARFCSLLNELGWEKDPLM